MSTHNHEVYKEFVNKPVDYRILKSAQQLATIVDDARYWRIVKAGDAPVAMLRVPLQVSNYDLLNIQNDFGLRIASREELASAFTSSPSHQYMYPWGDRPDVKNAPALMRANPHGMGMNVAGLYFNGPDNPADPEKNGLWMVTAEGGAEGDYVYGERSGTAGNVGVFDEPDAASCSTAVAGDRGVLPGTRAAIPGSRGLLAGEEKSEVNFLTPAGIGAGEELRGNEGYLMVRPLGEQAAEKYSAAIEALGNKIHADDGIPLIGIGDAAKVLGKKDMHFPVIAFGVVGHCLSCPNAISITTPINGPKIFEATGIPVVEFPEFAGHSVRIGGRDVMPIVPEGVDMSTAGRRIYC